MSYNKNPWNNKQPSNQLGGLNNLNHSGMLPFQQQPQVFQNVGLGQQNLGLGLQQMAANQLNLASNPIFQQQLTAVSYPNTRGLNPTAFQNASNTQGNAAGGTKQKVFTGSVTQIQENFGFIDDEVFFSRNVCLKGSNPVVGDRVLVEATFNPSMPFKWNATRVQVMQGGHSRDPRQHQGDSNNGFSRRGETGSRDFGNRDNRQKLNIGERRNRSRDRDDDEIERKRRREERMREREKEDKDRKSPIRRRSRSPKVARRRIRVVPRYMVQIPKITLNLSKADLLEIKKRYNNLYIPSDFFQTYIRWVDTFPADKPYAMNKPCAFHIMYKELDSIVENDAILEPSDADYRFSAKVMLMSVPGMEEIYQKCCYLAEEKDSRDRESEDRDYIHPTRLINFLVGLRGKNETMAIGGPWSPSLDGANPEKDPSVLIKTAIRTCKALTGIDLSNCTQWYRFVELYYRRGETTHKGKPVPARVETVVIFLPDVWSCLPTRVEWEELQQGYRKRLEKILKAGSGESVEEVEEAAECNDEKEEEWGETVMPTPHHQLNPKSMTVANLRTELIARNLDSKGLKPQLVARLTKALKAEAENEDGEANDNKDDCSEKEEDITEKEEVAGDKEKKPEPEEKKLDEVQKRRLEKQFTLPEQPHLIVHPSKTAKSGKFDCTSMCLSLLLDYRPEDTKEHSFEVSLFAELFNEMLMRDFGFNIFKALSAVPEKPKEKEEDKKKKEEKKKEKKDDDKSEDEETKTEDSSDTKKDKDEDRKKERDAKKDDRKSDSSDDDDDSHRSSKDKKKKDRVKLITKDKQLLLSFVYFDQTHCGYIFDKDIEELLYTLGLNLSRSQVKKIVNKVITRDSLHYRKLTDKPKDVEQVEGENGEKSVENPPDIHELALGNSKLLPVFEDDSASDAKAKTPQKKGKSASTTGNDGLVVYQGAVVDVGKLLAQLDRSEKARIDTEQFLVDLKHENQKISDKYAKSSSTIKHLTSEVKDYKDKLRSTEDALGKSNSHSKLFQTTLIDIRDKIEPVLKSIKEEKKERDRDGDKKKDRDDGKSRWEKDRKESDKDKKEHDVKKEAKEKESVKKEKKEVEEAATKNASEETEDVDMKEQKN